MLTLYHTLKDFENIVKCIFWNIANFLALPTFFFWNRDIIKNKSNELNSSKYWNTPLTKLDYYLIQIKKAADETSAELGTIHSDGSGFLLNYFERIEYQKKFQKLFGKYETFNISNNVYYDETKGKIIISLAVDNVGKAKQPMKTTCQAIMKRYMSSGYKLPQQTYRFASPNRRLLEQLYRGGSYDDYKDELEKFADNIVYYVNITSTTSHSLEKTDTETFNMGCYKLSFDDEMIYRKWSFATKEWYEKLFNTPSNIFWSNFYFCRYLLRTYI